MKPAYLDTKEAKQRPANSVLVHNHIAHGPRTSNGTRGFRAWYDAPAPLYVKCSCGWRSELGGHYRVKTKAEEAREAEWDAKLDRWVRVATNAVRKGPGGKRLSDDEFAAEPDDAFRARMTRRREDERTLKLLRRLGKRGKVDRSTLEQLRGLDVDKYMPRQPGNKGPRSWLKIDAAIRTLWPHGIPKLTSVKVRNSRIIKRAGVSERTVYRYFAEGA